MTTLPPFLFDTHTRYKEDTDLVATWLAETAEKYGHPFNAHTSKTRSSGRLKGKERKLARAAQKAGVDPEKNVPAIRCAITTKDFTDLADWIASLKPVLQRF